jgi:phospholipase/carboxylesterase
MTIETKRDFGFEHVLAPGNGNKTLLLLHGTGGDEHQLVDLGRRLLPDAALLSPRGQVLENGVAPRFFRRHGLGQFDIPDLLERTDELAEFVRSAVDAYELDPTNVTALGYSNGANIAASLLLRQPDVLSGAALIRATLPYEPETQPELSGTRVLLLSGRSDPLVPLEQSERLAAVLRSGGADVTHRVADDGHELLQPELAELASWL